MISRILRWFRRKPGVSIKLIDCKLSEVGYWRFCFHRNLLCVVHGHAGCKKVQIIPVGGLIDLNRFLTLQHLAGNHVAAARFLDGDEPVQLLSVTGYVKRDDTFNAIQGEKND